jgi:MYXO-CTERM domain-containing protein
LQKGDIVMNHATTVFAAALMLGSPIVGAQTIEKIEHPDLRGSKAGLAPHDIDGKPYMMRQVGAGFEHANVAVCGNYLLIAGVGSYERDVLGVTPDMHAYGNKINDNDRLQTMVVAAQLTKDGLEVGGAYYVLPELSGGNRNRDGMKPEVACLDGATGRFVIDSNYAPDDLARTYAAVFQVTRSENNDLFPMQVSPAAMVLESTDDNCSDRDYQDMIARPTAGGYRVNLTGSCNGNGADVAWVTYFDVACTGPNTCAVTPGPKSQVSQGQIERYRPQTFQLGPDTFMAIGTEGDSQPPRDGISATVFQGDTLTMLSSTTIASTLQNDLGTFYSTMSHAAQVAPDTFIVTYQMRNGQQRRGGKGGTTFMMGVLQADATTGAKWLVQPAEGLIEGFGATHHTACSARVGTPSDAKNAAFLVSASLTGGTAATGTFVTYDNGALQVGKTINLDSRIDTGLLSNYYGENPGNQGKNSLYCATIENPGYGVSGAYRPDVKEFVIVPATSRAPSPDGTLAEKLALDILLVPAIVDPTIDPHEGADEGTDIAGCGCSAQNDGDLPSLTVLALGCAALIRRRRRTQEVV